MRPGEACTQREVWQASRAPEARPASLALEAWLASQLDKPRVARGSAILACDTFLELLSSLSYFGFIFCFCLLVFVVNYSNNVLLKRNYFGYRGWPDDTIPFRFGEQVPNFTPSSSKDRVERLSQDSQVTLRDLITDAPSKGSNYHLLEKSSLLFGDHVTILDVAIYVYGQRWLRKVESVRIFLPDIAKSYLLVYLQKLLNPHTMNWNASKE